MCASGVQESMSWVHSAGCSPLGDAPSRRAAIGVVGGYAGGVLTLGDAIWKAVSVLLAVRAVGMEAYLGRDQGGEGAALDEAHLDGWGSISINCTVSAGGLSAGDVLGLARRWGRDGDREVGGLSKIKGLDSLSAMPARASRGMRVLQ